MSVTSPQRIIEFDVPEYYKCPPPLSFRQGTALLIENQTHRNDLNGRHVVCLGRDGMRTIVMSSLGDTLSMADSHLRIIELVPGIRVTIVGLTGDQAQHNGQTGILSLYAEAESRWSVVLENNDQQEEISVKSINVVITPAGGPMGGMNQTNQPVIGKKRRLISNLVSSASMSGDVKPLTGAAALLSLQPIHGASSRLMAIDASVAMSNQQPILKRCGTLRKLVHGFPGFAQLVVSVIVKLHVDPSHPGRVIDSPDIAEATKIAIILTDGKLDGIPRRDLRELVAGGVVALESVLRIADRYCGANHLVFAIDTNFAGIRDTITNMVQQITTGGITNVAVASSPPVEQEQMVKAESDDVIPPTAMVTDTPIVPFNNALTQLMQNRYSAVKAATEAEKDTSK